jgi:site-specific DNA-methyltransferase (cytosine-N4-specific)
VTPYVADGDFTLYVGDALEVLQGMPAESVHCVVTSPPYWGLRDYGTSSWAGGDPDCDHIQIERVMHAGRQGNATGTPPGAGRIGDEYFRDICGKCGATRADQQLGLEPTPDAYIERMVEVFREVRRVLRRDGTCWLNIGDSYAGNGQAQPQSKEVLPPSLANPREGMAGELFTTARTGNSVVPGLPSKNLVGIPWRLAFALQADGWYLRADVIWAKPNPMPESVTDRPTKAHEYVFLLTREARYFYDQESIRESATWDRWGDQTNGKYVDQDGMHAARMKPKSREELQAMAANGRNARSVWTIATQPYAEAHFATFPEELPRRCIAAGCPEDGVVLDPFIGSGTVALVARRLGRRSIGIELNPEYAELCARRLQQQSLFACVVGESAGLKDTVA